MRIQADITGTVCLVQVAVGQTVQEGDTLLIVESMKMEIPIAAPRGGTVRALHVGAGDAVQDATIVAELA